MRERTKPHGAIVFWPHPLSNFIADAYTVVTAWNRFQDATGIVNSCHKQLDLLVLSETDGQLINLCHRDLWNQYHIGETAIYLSVYAPNTVLNYSPKPPSHVTDPLRISSKIFQADRAMQLMLFSFIHFLYDNMGALQMPGLVNAK